MRYAPLWGAALGGGLLALGAGTASAQEVSADISARVGRSTSAEVRVCADGRVLSRLVGSCSGQASSRRTSVTVQAVRAGASSGSGGIRARVPPAGIGRRLGRDQAQPAQRHRVRPYLGHDQAGPGRRHRRGGQPVPAARPAAARPWPGDEPGRGGPARVEPFTLVGDPAADNLLPTGELPLADLTGEARPGSASPKSGQIASGNQVGVDVGDVPPSVPVTVCGNGAGVLGDVSASCGSDTSTDGIIAPPPATIRRGRVTPAPQAPRGRRQHRHLRHPGLTPGTSGLTAGSGALPFTGAASDLLAVLGAGLLAVGFLVVRAPRPDTATKGGGDR